MFLSFISIQYIFSNDLILVYQVTYLGQVQVKNQVFCNLVLLWGKVRKVEGR